MIRNIDPYLFRESAMPVHARHCILVTALIATITVAACATSPTGRTQFNLISNAELAQLGAAAFQEEKKKTPITTNAQASRYVQCVAQSITREVGGSWEVQVFESKDVNAFALPGNKVGVYTGLLKVVKNQDQLAAVIGHEIAHVIAGHSAARASNQRVIQAGAGAAAIAGVSSGTIEFGAQMAALGFLLPYSRGDETEADILGQQYMARAGFNPAEAAQLWTAMNASRNGGEPPELISTHPSDSSRIANLQRNLPQVQPLYDQARAAGRKPNCST